MKPTVFEMLRSRIDTGEILDTIALMTYSAITFRGYFNPVITEALSKVKSFQDLFTRLSDEPDVFQMLDDADVDMFLQMEEDIEFELDRIFDEAEDDLKKFLIETPQMKNMVMTDMRQRNVLLMPNALTADEIEMLYLSDFEKWDNLKKKLMDRIMSLQPVNAYRQGKKVWQEQKESEGILMDDEDFIRRLLRVLDKEGTMRMLCLEYYRAVQFGRHYEPVSEADQEDEDEDEFVDPSLLDPDETDELTDRSLFENDEPEEPDYLQEDGDMRDREFYLAGDIFDEYTGSREFDPSSEDNEATWTTYIERFISVIMKGFYEAFSTVLEQIEQDDPELLKNYAEQFNLSKDDYLDPLAYLDSESELKAFSMEYSYQTLDEFSMMPHDQAFQTGKLVQEELDAYSLSHPEAD